MSEKDVITDRYSLLYGDCLERMKEIPDGSVDMILCDLPYGTTACKWDSVIPFEPLWEQLNRVITSIGAIVLFGTEPFSSKLRTSNLDMFKYDIIWEKQKPSNFQLMRYQVGRVHEIISIFSNGATSYTKNGSAMTYNPQYTGEPYKRKSKVYGNNTNVTLRDAALCGKSLEEKEFKGKSPRSVIKFNVPIQNKKHPTQKPVALMEYLIRTYTNEGETVLDNCMGSGTTGVACLNTNRKFIGIEMNEKYFDIGVNRMATTMLQLQEVASEQLSTEQQESQLNKFFEIK